MEIIFSKKLSRNANKVVGEITSPKVELPGKQLGHTDATSCDCRTMHTSCDCSTMSTTCSCRSSSLFERQGKIVLLDENDKHNNSHSPASS